VTPDLYIIIMFSNSEANQVGIAHLASLHMLTVADDFACTPVPCRN
jgi:hypothetical protein